MKYPGEIMPTVTLLKENFKPKLSKYLDIELKKIFSPDDRVVIKLHMGEKGNPYYLKPDLIQPIITTLKLIGAEPVLFDTPTLYRGERATPEKYLQTAAWHGYEETLVGCQVVISDDSIQVKTKHLDAGVSNVIAECDGLVAASHVKGHACCGFGGAIKNLGMGGVDKKTKEKIHTYSRPKLNPEKCIGCGQCESICPNGAVKLENGLPILDYSKCWGCGQCIVKCESQALKPKHALFDELLSESAYAVLSRVKKKFFVNYLINISELCDCLSDPGKILVGDTGILLGDDIVSIDKASNDLITEKAGYDIFEKIHSKSGLVHINAGAKLGMGEMDYELSIG